MICIIEKRRVEKSILNYYNEREGRKSIMIVSALINGFMLIIKACTKRIMSILEKHEKSKTLEETKKN